MDEEKKREKLFENLRTPKHTLQLFSFKSSGEFTWVWRTFKHVLQWHLHIRDLTPNNTLERIFFEIFPAAHLRAAS
jgi:hypothetical protein